MQNRNYMFKFSNSWGNSQRGRMQPQTWARVIGWGAFDIRQRCGGDFPQWNTTMVLLGIPAEVFCAQHRIVTGVHSLCLTTRKKQETKSTRHIDSQKMFSLYKLFKKNVFGVSSSQIQSSWIKVSDIQGKNTFSCIDILRWMINEDFS